MTREMPGTGTGSRARKDQLTSCPQYLKKVYNMAHKREQCRTSPKDLYFNASLGSSSFKLAVSGGPPISGGEACSCEKPHSHIIQKIAQEKKGRYRPLLLLSIIFLNP